MADTPKTVRVEDSLWNAAVAKAEAQGTSASEVVRDSLRRYIDGEPVTDADRELAAAMQEVIQGMNQFAEAEKRRRARMARAAASTFRYMAASLEPKG